MPTRNCPSCESEMKPGFPLETYGDVGAYKVGQGDTGPWKALTQWIDGTPKMNQGWLGSERLDTSGAPSRFVLGFCCTGCGLINLFAVTPEDVARISGG